MEVSDKVSKLKTAKHDNNHEKLNATALETSGLTETIMDRKSQDRHAWLRNEKLFHFY